MGALTVAGSVEVTGIDVEDGRVRRVHTDQGDDRGRRRRHRLRRLEPADREDGRRLDPADAGGPPDDRHRPGADVRATPRRKSATRSSATWTRTCTSASTGTASRSARTPTGRSSWTPTTSPRSRRVGPLADDAAVHPGGLRPAARGRARAVPGDRRRRVGRREARDQRPAVADARRQPDHRRDARGQGPLVRGRDLDQGGARDRQDDRRVDDERRARDRPARLGHRPVLRPPPDRPAHRGPDDRGLQQDLRHRPPDGAVGLEPRRSGSRRSYERAEGARRGVLRGRRLGAAVLVRHERAAPRASTATGSCRARPSGSRAGGRRSSTPSTSRCATGSGWSTCRRS